LLNFEILIQNKYSMLGHAELAKYLARKLTSFTGVLGYP
jgi:hypothetical protein